MGGLNANRACEDGFRAAPIPDAFPRRVTIELSSCCNLSCVMCPRQYLSGESGFMEDALFGKIVQEIGSEEVEAVVPFFRGESLLHPRFMELLGLLRRHCRSRIQLATNGLLLSEEMIHDLLFKIRIDFISFSLDAVTEETYRKIRRGGSLEKARENALKFLRLRDDSGSTGTAVQVSLTESVFNLEEIASFIGYWRSRADRVRIYPRHSEGGNFGALASPGFRRDSVERSHCMKPFTDIVIYHDGRVALCNHDWDRPESASLGSVREKSIHEIWEDLPYRHVRERQHRGDWERLEPCRHCDHWQGSDGGEPIGHVIMKPQAVSGDSGH
jgi:radical SAM protein with 4Fe4S-binding SPASM domain